MGAGLPPEPINSADGGIHPRYRVSSDPMKRARDCDARQWMLLFSRMWLLGGSSATRLMLTAIQHISPEVHHKTLQVEQTVGLPNPGCVMQSNWSLRYESNGGLMYHHGQSHAVAAYSGVRIESVRFRGEERASRRRHAPQATRAPDSNGDIFRLENLQAGVL